MQEKGSTSRRGILPAGCWRGSAWSIPAGGNAGWGRAPHLGSLLLKFLNGPFVDAPAFVDEVPGGGGFPRVHMPDDDDVDVRLLLPHAAAGLRGAGRGGRRWGGRWERSCLFGGEAARGKGSGASKRAPLVPAPSQPLGKGCPPLAPPSRWTMRPEVPGLVWQGWVRASVPRRRPAGLFRAATSSLQVSARRRVYRHLALLRGDPQFPALRHRCFEGALPSWKTFPTLRGCSRCCLLALSKREGISCMPWEEPRAPVLPGCPHRSPAGHSSGDNRASAKRGGQK